MCMLGLDDNKPQGRGTLGRPRSRLEDYIKIDLCDVGWGGGMD